MRSIRRNSWIWLWCCMGCDTAGAAVVSNATAAADAERGSEAPQAQQAQTQAQAPTCGQHDLPDCPLQRWMKSTLQAYQRAEDYPRLARALGELAQHQPTGYNGWEALAHRGVAAAEASDGAALRRVCKDCHEQQRKRYRKELRATPLW